MLKVLAKVLISLGILSWFAFNIELQQVVNAIKNLSVADSIIIIGTLFALAIPLAWRWRLVAGQLNVSLPIQLAISTTLISFFLNQTLPSTVGGDAIRVWRWNRAGAPLEKAIGVVTSDRLSGILGLVGLIVIMLPWTLSIIPSREAIVLGVGLAAVLVLGCVSLGILAPILSGYKNTNRLVEVLRQVAQGMRVLMSRPVHALMVLGISILGHITVAVVVFYIAIKLGATMTFIETLALFPLVFLVSMVPITIAGWGVREGAMATALSFVNVSGEIAVSVSVVYGIAMLATGIPGGMLWIYSKSSGSSVPYKSS